MNGLRTVLLATTLLLAAAGCGGEDAGDPVAEAAAATAEAGTFRVAYEASFLMADGTTNAFRGEGGADLEAGRGRMVYDVSELPGTAVGAAEVEVRIDGSVVYVRFPPGTEGLQLPEGKEWLRADAAQVAAQTELDVGAVHQDPSLFLRYLQHGLAEVQEEGTEEVRGEETTTYTAVLELDRVVEGLDELEGEEGGARAQVERIRSQVGSTLPVTVNVDGEGRIRRIIMTFELQGDGRPGTLLSTTEFYDFGTSVDVDPPPSELVVEAGAAGAGG